MSTVSTSCDASCQNTAGDFGSSSFPAFIMNKDKRRRARIQGGWAATENNIRSDAGKPTVSAAPAWLGKTVDVPQQTTPRQFVYEKPEEVVRPLQFTTAALSFSLDLVSFLRIHVTRLALTT